MRMIQMEGQKYGKLLVQEHISTSPRGMRKFKCLCDCGNTTNVSLANLRSGHTKSCGCIDKTGSNNVNFTHGFKQSNKTYKAWCKIKERCYNKNSSDYFNYGAKGIVLSDSFKSDFLLFYAEIGDAPSKDYSVDRVDYTKGYIEGNLRWATDKQQSRNRGKMKTNTSGFTGVHIEDKVHPNGLDSTTYVIAQWKEYKEDRQIHCKKSFSVKKLGLLPAFAKACAYREQKILELNAAGYGYSDNHGK